MLRAKGRGRDLKKGQTHRDSLSLIPADVCRLRPLRSVHVFTRGVQSSDTGMVEANLVDLNPQDSIKEDSSLFPYCRMHLIPWLASSRFWLLPVWSRVKLNFLIGLEGRSVKCACTGLAQLVPCGCWCAFPFPWSLPLSPGVTHEDGIERSHGSLKWTDGFLSGHLYQPCIFLTILSGKVFSTQC